MFQCFLYINQNHQYNTNFKEKLKFIQSYNIYLCLGLLLGSILLLNLCLERDKSTNEKIDEEEADTRSSIQNLNINETFVSRNSSQGPQYEYNETEFEESEPETKNDEDLKPSFVNPELEQRKFFDLFKEMLSFPPIETSQFTEKGHDYFQSKIQIIIFLPSLFMIYLLLVFQVYPIINQKPIDSKLVINELCLRNEVGNSIVLPRNNTNNEPVGEFYALINNLIGKEISLKK